MIGAQLPIRIIQRMGNRMMNSGERQIFLKLVNIPFDPLDLDMLRLSQVPEKQVDLDAILGKVGGHFLTDKRVRIICDLQATVDPIVIGESNISHPLFLQPAVQHPWIGIAVGELKAAKNPFRGSIAELRMNMEIDFRSHFVSRDSVRAERMSHLLHTPGNGLFRPPAARPDPRPVNAEDPADECRSESMEHGSGGERAIDSRRDWSPRAKKRECSKRAIASGYRRSDRRFAPCPIESCTGSQACQLRFRRPHPATRQA